MAAQFAELLELDESSSFGHKVEVCDEVRRTRQCVFTSYEKKSSIRRPAIEQIGINK